MIHRRDQPAGWQQAGIAGRPAGLPRSHSAGRRSVPRARIAQDANTQANALLPKAARGEAAPGRRGATHALARQEADGWRDPSGGAAANTKCRTSHSPMPPSRATQVEPDRDLISLIPTIVEQGFVFVLAQDRTLAGIVTTADLGDQFATLASRFV